MSSSKLNPGALPMSPELFLTVLYAVNQSVLSAASKETTLTSAGKTQNLIGKMMINALLRTFGYANGFLYSCKKHVEGDNCFGLAHLQLFGNLRRGVNWIHCRHRQPDVGSTAQEKCIF